jgi:hypothetical protein
MYCAHVHSVYFSPHTIDISKRRVHLHLHRLESRWHPQGAGWRRVPCAPAAEAPSVIVGATSPCDGAPSPSSASLLPAHRGRASERRAVVPTSEHHRTSSVTTVSDSASTRLSSAAGDLPGQLQAAGPQGGSSGQCQNDGVLREELH